MAVGGKGAENGRGCVHVQRRLPALSAASLAVTDERQGHGLRMPRSFAREVRSTSCKQLMDGNKLEVSDWNLKFEDKSNSGRLAGQCQLSVYDGGIGFLINVGFYDILH